MNENDFSQFIKRTSAFNAKVTNNIAGLFPIPEVRYIVAFQSGLLAFEHSTAALQLTSSGLLPSAFSLYRSQFECLVRGVWLLHAATDTWVEKLSQPLTIENANKANDVPGLAEMLMKLDKSDAPQHLVKQLKQFKDITYKALSSYTHGGIHPLSRTITGYPVKLTYDSMRNANAVTALTAQLLAILSGDQENMVPIKKLHIEFFDCLPVINI